LVSGCLFQNHLEGLINLQQINGGVDAGTMGTLIQHAQYRQGIAIFDARGEITLAGYGQHQLGPLFLDDLACQGSSGCH